MKKAEAIEWLEIMKEDAIFEQHDALKIAIEALQTAEINCVHCPRYYETEDDIGVHSHCGSHGRLIDADALMEYCSNQKTKTISNNDIARFPTADAVSREEYDKMKEIAKSWQDEFRNASEIANKLSANRPHGEWIEEYADANGDKWYRCSHCGERFVLIEKGEASTEPYHFCPNCEADMRQNK